MRDPTIYCNCCGNEYVKELMPCCDDPQIGTNKTLLKMMIEENNHIRAGLADEYAANQSFNMRWGIRILPRLLNEMEKYFRQYGEKVFNNDKELTQFMKDYPYFCIPKKV